MARPPKQPQCRKCRERVQWDDPIWFLSAYIAGGIHSPRAKTLHCVPCAERMLEEDPPPSYYGEPTKEYCKGCFRDMWRFIWHDRHPKSFCSNTCEQRYYYRRANRNNEPSSHTKLCDYCQEEFQSSRKDAKYCQAKCRVQANRIKKKKET